MYRRIGELYLYCSKTPVIIISHKFNNTNIIKVQLNEPHGTNIIIKEITC